MFERIAAKPVSGGKQKRRIKLNKSKISFYIGRFFLYLLLLDISYVFLYPIIHMLITSVKDMHDMMDVTVRWIPTRLFFKNYSIALTVLDFKTGFLNSVIITVICTAGHLISASFVGYGFARYKFPGRNILFAIVILNIIIPIQVIIVPMFYQFTQVFGLLDSNLPIILPTLFGYGLRGGLYIFLFRQFFINLPKELEEAAHIDGCGKIGTHFRIILPVSGPVCMVTIVLSMVWHWNDHFEPMVYLFTPQKQTLTYQLPLLFHRLQEIQAHILKGEYQYIAFPPEICDMFLKELSLDALMMASVNICILPILIVYGFLQRKFVHGIESTGIKG